MSPIRFLIVCLVCFMPALPVRGDDPPQPKTHTVAAGPFESTVSLEGWVQMTNLVEVVLKPEEWATFTVESAVEYGTPVKEGDTLITFDSKGIEREISDLKQQIAAGELGIKLARIELELLEKSQPFELEAAERTALVAREEWEYYQQTGEKLEKEANEQQLKSVQDMLDGSKEELAQLEKMYKADDLTEETEEIILKRARREVERGEFTLLQTQVHHDRRVKEELPREKRLKEVAKDREAQNLEKAKVALPLTTAQKKVELEKLELAQTQLTDKLTRLQKDRALMTIKSPANGYARLGQVERGRWVSADSMKGNLRRGGTIPAHQVIYTIEGPGPGIVHVDIPEKDRGVLKAGQTGEMVPTAHPHVRIPCELKVFHNGFVKEGTMAAILLGQPKDEGTDAPVITGMSIKARMVVFSDKDVIAVPSSAVFTDEDDPLSKYVWLKIADGEPKQQPVEVGLTSATRTHIKSGLKAGDQILLQKPEEK